MKKGIFFLTALILVGLIYLIKSKSQTADTSTSLVVYTYTSFSSDWGAGPDIAKLFEEKYKVKVRLIDAGDSRLVVQKLQLEGTHATADVVMGLDQYSLLGAQEKLNWMPIEGMQPKWHPRLPKKTVKDKLFVPIDWAPLSFIYRQGEITPPQQLGDLLSRQYKNKIVLLDPRTSTPGFIFLEWVKQEYGDGSADLLKKLNPSLLSYAPSWSVGYGLFKKGEAQLVFSYITSAVYHWVEEKNETYQAALFKKGQPFQIEYVGVPRSCRMCDMAQEFVRFLLTEEIQKIIMEKNYMLPALEGIEQGTPFSKLEYSSLLLPSVVDEKKFQLYIDEWKASVQ